MDKLELSLFFVYLSQIVQAALASASVSGMTAAVAHAGTQEAAVRALLEALQREENFQSIVLMRRHSEDCFVTDFLGSQPRLLLSADQHVYLKGRYSSKLLMLLCLNGHIDARLLQSMADNLQHMRSTRTLLLLRNFQEHGSSLQRVFRLCSQLQMLKVLAIFENYALHGRVYSFSRFPQFKVQLKHASALFYPDPVKNLHRSQLLSMPSVDEPESILYVNKQGTRRIAGYIYHLVSNFAEKLNATLRYKYPLNMSDHWETNILANLTRHHELDLPMCLDTPFVQNALYDFSDIVEITTCQPMIPSANYLETYKFYLGFISSYFLLLDVLFYFSLSLFHTVLASRCGQRAFNCLDCILNDKVLRAMLGQSFKLVRHPSYQLRFVYLLLLMQGNIRSTLFSAYLDALLSYPPTAAPINSFDELKHAGTRILMPFYEFQLLQNLSTPQFMANFSDIFQTVQHVHEFQALRKSLNTEFAYSTRFSSWTLFDKQQKYFSHRLFMVSEHVMFSRSLLLAIPMAQNSIYRDAFNRFIGQMQSCGLWRRWNMMNFYEMVEAKKMSFKDLSTKHSYKPLTVQDFYYVWLLYLTFLGIATVCFIVEMARNLF